jgi:hypothetical protein
MAKRASPLWILGIVGVLAIATLGVIQFIRVIQQELNLAKQYRHPLSLALSFDGKLIYYDSIVDGVPVIVVDSRSRWGNSPRLLESNARKPVLSSDGLDLYVHRGEDSYGDFTEIWCKNLVTNQCRLIINATDFHLPSISLESVSRDGALLIVSYPDYSEGIGNRRLFRSDGTPVDRFPTCDEAWFSGECILAKRKGKYQLFRLDDFTETDVPSKFGPIQFISNDGSVALVQATEVENEEENRYYLLAMNDRQTIAQIDASFVVLSEDGKLAAFRKAGGTMGGESGVFLVDQDKIISFGKLMEPTAWISSPGGLAYRNAVMIQVFDATTQTLMSYPVRPLKIQATPNKPVR